MHHIQGLPNTAHYEHESMVDNFLDSLQFNKERLIRNNSCLGEKLGPIINKTVSSLPELQVSKSRKVPSRARLCFIDSDSCIHFRISGQLSFYTYLCYKLING